jgi:hypothetical protein
MGLEGMKVGFTKKDVNKLRKEKEKRDAPIKLNFKTAKRESKSIDRVSPTIEWCKAHGESEITEAWKKAFIKKKLSPSDQEVYKDLCYYLERKFNCVLPKK